MKTAILGLVCVALVSQSSSAVGEPTPLDIPPDISGHDPAIPMELVIVCPACGYNVSLKRLSGVLDPTWTAHTYPLTSMQLRLFDSSGNLLSGPHNLTPTAAYGNQNMSQSISTSITGGVARVVLSYHSADGYDLWQNVIVQ